MDLVRTAWRYRRTPFWRLLMFASGAYIPRSARFADQPCFPHAFKGIFISGGASIGRNCVIFQQVTIGSNTLIDSKSFGAPTIGDNCYIGAGAKIIGGIRIGNNVRVAANAVVSTDIPDNATVVPGRAPISSDSPKDNRYFRKSDESWVFYRDERWHHASPDEQAKLGSLAAKRPR